MTVRPEILVGVDGCPSGDAAVVWAAGEAASRGAGLVLVHALDMNSFGLWMMTAALRNTFRKTAQPIIGHALELAAAAQPSVPARGRVLIGSPTRTLLLLSSKAALTVVGRSGRGALARVWLGAVTQRVLTHASSPAIAAGGSDATTAGTISRIVVGMGDGPAESAVLDFAFSTAQRRCVPLAALHIEPPWPSPSSGLIDDLYPEHGEAEERQLKGLREWGRTYPGVSVASIVRSGHLGDIFRAECRPNDLVVLGHHRCAPYSPRQLGPAANAALHDAGCSVAVVHDPATNTAR